MSFFIWALILGALAYWAFYTAVNYIAQFTLIRVEPGEPGVLMMGWEMLPFGWTFMVLGALLALIVLPFLTRSYRAANELDLKRAVSAARYRMELAEKQAREAGEVAQRTAKHDYAKKLQALEEREAEHRRAVDHVEEELEDLNESVTFYQDRLAAMAVDLEAAETAKNNAMSAATRQRKKVAKLKATIEELTSGNR